MELKLQERIMYAFFRYGRFCASHAFVLLICSITAFLLLCRPVVRLSLSRISFDSRVMTYAELDHVTQPLAGFAIQIVVRRKKSNVPFTSNDILDVNQRLYEALKQAQKTDTGNGKFEQKSDHEKPDHKIWECKTLLEVVNEHSSPTALPKCVTIYAADLSIEEIESALAERESSTIRQFIRAITKNKPNLLDTVQTIVFDSHKQYSREDKSKGQFSLVLLFRDKPVPEFFRTLCAALSKDFDVARCNAALSNGQYVSLSYNTTSYRRFMFSVPVSYGVLVLYVYFTVSKISMVTSKWGLALSAVMTVFMSLVGAEGICARFNLTPTVWITEYFPYLALLVGLENSLCITRSVVSMPVRLDPVDRLAYGLSTEGWGLIRNFVFHVCILIVGYFTFVPDIQEFCIFGLIGYFVDFSMQLFFYSPCLYFDLRRVNPEMLEDIRRQQLAMQPISLQHYSKGTCPVNATFPRLGDFRSKLMRLFFDDSGRLKRYRSEGMLNETGIVPPESPSPVFRRHRRTHSHATARGLRTSSTESIPHDYTVSRRFRLLQYWTSNRLITKFLTILITCWIAWLAIFVHKLEELNEVARRFDPPGDQGAEADFDPNDLEQREDSGLYWAQLYHLMGWDLSGKALIVAPFLYVNVYVPHAPADGASVSGGAMIGSSIIFVLLLMCLFLYLMGYMYRRRRQPNFVLKSQSRKPVRKRTGSKEIVDSLPIVFKGHEWPIEAVVIDAQGAVAVSCSMCRILVWDTCTGDCLRNLKWQGRSGSSDPQQNYTQDISIWAAALWNQILAVSYSDGAICVWNIVNGQPICKFDFGHPGENQQKGACILRWQSAKTLVAVRPPGSLEFLEFDISRMCLVLKRRLTAHQHNINGLEICDNFVYTLSDDMTVKSFDAVTYQTMNTFYGHNDSVVCLVIDQDSDFMFSTDLSGLICAWNRRECTLAYTIAGISPPISLTLFKDFLVGKSSSGVLYLWAKASGSAKSTIKLRGQDFGEEMWKSCYSPQKMVLLSDEYLVLDWGGKLHLWDLNHKYLLRTVELESSSVLSSINHLSKIDNSSVLCSIGRFVYRVNFPVIQIK